MTEAQEIREIQDHLNIHYIESHHGLLSIYMKGHMDTGEFAKEVLNDDMARLHLKLMDFPRDNERVKSEAQHVFIRQLSDDEIMKRRCGDEFGHWLEWCSAEEPGAYPATQIFFERTL